MNAASLGRCSGRSWWWPHRRNRMPRSASNQSTRWPPRWRPGPPARRRAGAGRRRWPWPGHRPVASSARPDRRRRDALMGFRGRAGRHSLQEHIGIDLYGTCRCSVMGREASVVGSVTAVTHRLGYEGTGNHRACARPRPLTSAVTNGQGAPRLSNRTLPRPVRREPVPGDASPASGPIFRRRGFQSSHQRVLELSTSCGLIRYDSGISAPHR